MPSESVSSYQKIKDKLIEKKSLNNGASVQYHRVILTDLPFNGQLNGQPGLLADKHKESIDRVINQAGHYNIVFHKITGFASQPGSNELNQTLSIDRAEAVRLHILDAAVPRLDIPTSSYSNMLVNGVGEQEAPVDDEDLADHPLNRRVEITYSLNRSYPVAAGDTVTRSKKWEIEFSEPISASSAFKNMEGVLTMHPDDDTGNSEVIKRTFNFNNYGIGVGALSLLNEAKALKKYPKILKTLKVLEDPEAGVPLSEKNQESLLTEMASSVGISWSDKNYGGHFVTEQPLSFEELGEFDYASISYPASFYGPGEVSLLYLSSPYLSNWTSINRTGDAADVADLKVKVVPMGGIKLQSA